MLHLVIFSHLPPIPGIHWSFYWIHNFAFSGASYRITLHLITLHYFLHFADNVFFIHRSFLVYSKYIDAIFFKAVFALFESLCYILVILAVFHTFSLLYLLWLSGSSSVQFSRSVMSDFATPWTAACQASLSITNSRSPPKPMCIEPVMPSNHLILCRPLLLLPSIFPSIRVFSNESALCISWPKY